MLFRSSADFDPKASQPTAEDVLSTCLDAMGMLFESLLSGGSKKNEEALLADSLGSFEKIPMEWTELEVQKRRIFIRFDRSNPKLDHLATDWLKKNDPKMGVFEDEFEEETSELFVRGPRNGRVDDDEDH